MCQPSFQATLTLMLIRVATAGLAAVVAAAGESCTPSAGAGTAHTDGPPGAEASPTAKFAGKAQPGAHVAPDTIANPLLMAPGVWRARVHVAGKWGLIGPGGQWVAEPEFELLLPFSEHLAAAVHAGGLVGYIDSTGRFAIAPEFHGPGANCTEAFSALSFHRGLAVAFNERGKCGFINRAGRFRVLPTFDFAWPFMANGLAFVKKGDKLGLIDSLGRQVLPPMIESLNPGRPGLFSEGLEPVLVNGKWGYLSRNGQFAILAAYLNAGPFQNGRAAVQTPHGFSYINRQGHVTTWIDFADGRDFAEGRAAVRVGQEWCYIDTSGKVVIFPRFAEAYDFADSLAVVRVGEAYGLLAPDGAERLPIAFEDIRYPVPPGALIPVLQGGLWGFATREGNVLVRPQFADVRPHRNGFAAVKKPHGQWGFADAQGRLATPLSFEEVGDVEGGVAPAKANGLWGYINTQGQWLIQPQFEYAQPFEGIGR